MGLAIKRSRLSFDLYSLLDKSGDDKSFKLFSVKPSYKYEKNVKTDEIIGYDYEVGDPVSCESFSVRCPKLVITNEEIAEENDTGFSCQCHFVDTKCVPYKFDNSKLLFTVVASEVVIDRI